jgi:hypothetical protein
MSVKPPYPAPDRLRKVFSLSAGLDVLISAIDVLSLFVDPGSYIAWVYCVNIQSPLQF